MQKQATSSKRGSLSKILIIVAVASAVMLLVWPAVQSNARAAALRARHADLSQARARWEAQGFPSYRLSLQLQSWDNPVCEVVFEVRAAMPPKVALDTCAMRNDTALSNFVEKHASVPDLFNYIESTIDQWGGCGPNGCACDGRKIVDVLYDRERGYPQSFTERYQHDWTTRRLFPSACTLVGPSERIVFAASVSSLA